MKRTIALPVSVLASALLATGCTSNSTSGAADLGAAAGQECDGEKITITQSTAGFLYFPSYVAEQAGFYKDAGLDPTITDLGGGAEAIAAVLGGSAEIALTSFPSVVTAADEGAPVQAFASVMTQYGSNVVISPEAAREAGVDENSSASDKIRALEGLTVGVTSPGSATDQLMRYMLAQEGMDPDADVNLLPMGDSGSILAGYKQGRLDAFTLSSPTSDLAVQDGGNLLFNLSEGEYPDLDGFQYMVAMTSNKVANDRPQVLSCFTEALDRALDLIEEDPDQAVELARAAFGDIDAELYEEAAASNLAAYPASPVIDEQKAQRAFAFLEQIDQSADIALEEVVDTELAKSVAAGGQDG